eukprot:g3296.t1
MRIPWPLNYRTLFRIEGLLSSVGEEFLDIRCALEEPIPIATIEYYKTLGYAILPFVLVLLSLLGWCTCGGLVKRTERRAMMVGTIVLLIYLAFPSIAAGAFELWRCEYVKEVGYIFVSDPETLCSDESHRQWQNLLGWPCILLYVLGLPATGLGYLYRFRNKLDEPHTRIRFGQLYDGFSRENYLYEGWVTLRKLLVIVIGIFTDKLQVLLAIGSVGLLLGHTIFRQPYQTRSLTHLDELLLSCVFFTYWVGGIFSVFPQCHSDVWEAEVCTAGMWVVLLFNIACGVIGFGMCIWLTWVEEREQLQGASMGVFAAISRWRICHPCCRKGNHQGCRLYVLCVLLVILPVLALPEVELRAVLSVPDPKVRLLAIRPALALPEVELRAVPSAPDPKARLLVVLPALASPEVVGIMPKQRLARK